MRHGKKRSACCNVQNNLVAKQELFICANEHCVHNSLKDVMECMGWHKFSEDVAKTWDLIQGILNGVKYMHDDRNTLHCDLKPVSFDY